MLVESQGLLSYSASILEAKTGKLDFKISPPDVIYISLQVASLVKLAIMTKLSIFVSIKHHECVIQKV